MGSRTIPEPATPRAATVLINPPAAIIIISKKIANDLGIVSDRLSDAINIFYMYMGWDLYNDLIEVAKRIDPHSSQKGGFVDPYWIMPPNAYKNTDFPLPINLTEFQEFAEDEKYGELREKNENYRKFLKTHFDLS